MNDEEKQKIWSIRNIIVERCHQTIKNLARQDYDNVVNDISAIEIIIEAFYKDNAN